MVVEDAVAEGDKAAIRCTITGTHKGKLGDIAATGKPVKITGMSLYRLVNGRIVDDWPAMDALSLLQQIGAVRKFS